jgi:hypothetical protein
MFSNSSNKKEKEVVKPPMLFEKTQENIKKIEKYLGHQLICYWNSYNGSICSSDVTGFYELIKNLPIQEKLYLFIKSDGGDGKVALRIVNLLREHTKELNVLISGECASAATMMALGANKIYMGPLAFLSAVDTSLTHDLSPLDRNNDLVSVNQDELARVIRLWKQNPIEGINPHQSLFPYVHPLVIGAVDRASSLSVKLCKEILSYHLSDENKALEISNILNSEYPSHGYPITLKEARRIGLDVEEMDKSLSDMLFELSRVYSEMSFKAITDYDEINYHDHEIRNIIETNGAQVYYQVDKDWHYRMEERKYIPMNDKSSWRKASFINNKAHSEVFYIR